MNVLMKILLISVDWASGIGLCDNSISILYISVSVYYLFLSIRSKELRVNNFDNAQLSPNNEK